MFKSWLFCVIFEMLLLVCLIGYYIDSNECVVVDSILFRIDDKFLIEVMVYYLVNCEMIVCVLIFWMI